LFFGVAGRPSAPTGPLRDTVSGPKEQENLRKMSGDMDYVWGIFAVGLEDVWMYVQKAVWKVFGNVLKCF